MSVYSLAPIFNPQLIGNPAAALVLAPTSAAGGTVVPAGYAYQIAVLRVANVTGAPVSFKAWRVNAGGAADNQHVVVPSINIPVATQTFPHFDVTELWGAVLQAGDAIWMLAGSANALSVQGDGAVIQI